jgi:hypothetical protein
LEPKQPSCFGVHDGRIIASVQSIDGQPVTYTYSINGGAFQASGTFLNLAPGTYTITAKDPNGCTASKAITLVGPQPSNIESIGSLTTTTATISWRIASLTIPNIGHSLAYRVMGADSWTETAISTALSITLTGLQPETRYEVRLRTHCGTIGASDWTAAATFVTLPTGANCAPPSAIVTRNLSATETAVSWTNRNSAICYVISYGLASQPESNWQTLTFPAGVNPIALQGLTNGALYGVRLRSNCSGCSATAGSLSEPSQVITFRAGNLQPKDFVAETSTNTTNLSVYPNPSKGRFAVQLQLKEFATVQLQIVDLTGKVVYKLVDSLPDGNQLVHVDAQDVSKGVYILQLTIDSVQGNKTQYNSRIIVE